MEAFVIGAILALVVFAIVVLRRRSRPQYGTVNYLIPSKDDEPLTPREVFVAGVNHVGMCGEHRQTLIAKLRKGDSIYLVRMPDHPEDRNAVVLYGEDGKGYWFPTTRDGRRDCAASRQGIASHSYRFIC
jgi:hypothetical protein